MLVAQLPENLKDHIILNEGDFPTYQSVLQGITEYLKSKKVNAKKSSKDPDAMDVDLIAKTIEAIQRASGRIRLAVSPATEL